MLLSVTEHLTEFNQAAEKLMKGRVSQQNFELIKYPSLNYPQQKSWKHLSELLTNAKESDRIVKYV